MTPTAHHDGEHVVIRIEGEEARLTIEEAAALRARIDDAARLARRHRDDRAKAERAAAEHAGWAAKYPEAEGWRIHSPARPSPGAYRVAWHPETGEFVGHIYHPPKDWHIPARAYGGRVQHLLSRGRCVHCGVGAASPTVLPIDNDMAKCTAWRRAEGKQ